MSARENRAGYRKLATSIRAIPGRFGLRPWRVYLATGTWSVAGHAGNGIESQALIELLENGQPPKLRQPIAKMVALGLIEAGQWDLGPVTPEAGTPWSILLGKLLSEGQTFRVVLVNDETADRIELVVKNGQQDRALRFTAQMVPIR